MALLGVTSHQEEFQSQDLQDENHKEPKTSSYINPNTMQAHITIQVSPQIDKAPPPPELQPSQSTAPID